MRLMVLLFGSGDIRNAFRIRGHKQYPLLLFLPRLRTLRKTTSFPEAPLSILALGSDGQRLGLAASAEVISSSSATEL